MRLLVIALAAGCVESDFVPPASHVWIDADGEGGDAFYADAAAGWEELGFSITDYDGGLPGCAGRRGESIRGPDCQVHLWISRIPMLRERVGSDGVADLNTRAIAIDTRITDDLQLRAVVTHEVGHIILYAAEEATGIAIMAGTSLTPTDIDREIACRNVLICQGDL